MVTLTSDATPQPRLSTLPGTGRLGCATCYDTFSEGLQSLLKGMHKGTEHKGKVPSRLQRSLEREQQLKDLHRTLRKAVSQAIDKDYIVNTLMGGFGVKGTVPIAISNPLYVNTSATPPAFDINAGRTALLNAGFRDCNGDGFLDAPDCSPVKATLSPCTLRSPPKPTTSSAATSSPR